MNILLNISYDGTDFFGYQVQPNKRTVQSELENAIFVLTGEKVKTIASGRTDSGVHAKKQAVNFHTQSKIPPTKFCDALNSLLPSDVKVVSSKKVDGDFNARYCAKNKTYEYYCYFSEIDQPLLGRYAVKIPYEVDFNLKRETLKLFEGEHDFKCFLASGSSVKDTVRTIYKAKAVKVKGGVKFTFTGNGFLYNMVRIMVGTLLAIGAKTKTINDLKTALSTGNRNLVGKTMQPNGLVLEKVIY
jgi:tRNA pseudouridine38-40 synthase